MYVLLPTKIELVRKANIYVTIEGYKGKITEILIFDVVGKLLTIVCPVGEN